MDDRARNFRSGGRRRGYISDHSGRAGTDKSGCSFSGPLADGSADQHHSRKQQHFSGFDRAARNAPSKPISSATCPAHPFQRSRPTSDTSTPARARVSGGTLNVALALRGLPGHPPASAGRRDGASSTGSRHGRSSSLFRMRSGKTAPRNVLFAGRRLPCGSLRLTKQRRQRAGRRAEVCWPGAARR